MNFTIRLLIWFKGKFVGKDCFDNSYYEEKLKGIYNGRQSRRWVIYKSGHDASKIPPEWHAWLHYRADEPLKQQAYACQPPKPNLVNTSADMPDLVESDKVVKLSIKNKRSYQPWTPNE